MSTRIWRGYRFALLAAGISVGTAWSANPALYQLHTDGSIWQYTGAPCKGNVCSGWLERGADASVVQIAAGVGSLYDLTFDSAIGSFTNPNWQLLTNSASYPQRIAAGGNQLMSYWYDGSLWQYSTQNCGGTCPWIQIDNNGNTDRVVTGDTGTFQMHWDGSIWGYTGVPCTMQYHDPYWYAGPCTGWVQMDGNPNSASVAAGMSAVYQLWNNGAIWQYTGVPCNANGCTGWKLIENYGNSTQIAAGGGMYQAQNNGSVWQYTGTPCNGSVCSGWIQLDNNPDLAYIVAGPTTVYEVHKSGSIWQYTGPSCNGSVCSGWIELDDNPNTISVVAGF